MKMYPRLDNEYRKKESIDYDLFRSKLYYNWTCSKNVRINEWIVFFLIGLVVGTISFFMDLFLEKALALRWMITQKAIDY